jgi:hypothetical protein
MHRPYKDFLQSSPTFCKLIHVNSNVKQVHWREKERERERERHALDTALKPVSTSRCFFVEPKKAVSEDGTEVRMFW